jgi:hypothetical protein
MQRATFKSPSECAGLRIEGGEGVSRSGGGGSRSGGAENIKKKPHAFTTRNPEQILEIKEVETNDAAGMCILVYVRLYQ